MVFLSLSHIFLLTLWSLTFSGLCTSNEGIPWLERWFSTCTLCRFRIDSNWMSFTCSFHLLSSKALRWWWRWGWLMLLSMAKIKNSFIHITFSLFYLYYFYFLHLSLSLSLSLSVSSWAFESYYESRSQLGIFHDQESTTSDILFLFSCFVFTVTTTTCFICKP